MALNEAQKSELMRKGNLLYNDGKYFEAGKIFNVIGYKTGLIRLGDLFYFEKEMPLVAYGFYRNANHRPMLDKIGESFVFALKCLLYEPGAESGRKGPQAPAKSRPVADDEVKVRQANSADAGIAGNPPTQAESKENKVARAVAMLKNLS
jgi:hypothetical protein